MESLLAVLNRITPYGSERGFVELCWHQLRIKLKTWGISGNFKHKV